jgi:hypothetical protein
MVVGNVFFCIAFIWFFCSGEALMSLYLIWRPFSTAPIDHRASG